MNLQESDDDTEDFLAQFQLPPSCIQIAWDTLLPPAKWTCPSDHHDNGHDIEDKDSSVSNVNCALECDSSSMSSKKENQVTEYMLDEALLKELGYSDSEDDAPEWTNRHLLNPAEAPPSEPAYTAAPRPTVPNPVYLSVPPTQRLYRLLNNQMARMVSSKASSSLLRRPSSEPIRSACSHPPANFVVSPSCPYFGLVPSRVEIELERRQARQAQREPRIDQVFMDELHNMWTERRKTRHMVEKFVQNVIHSATQRLEAELQGTEVTNDVVHKRWTETRKTQHMVERFVQNVIDGAAQRLEAELQGSVVTNNMVHKRWTETRKTQHMVEEFVKNVIHSATQRLEAELQGVIQPPRVEGELSRASTRVVDKNDTQRTGAVGSEVTNDVSPSSSGTSTVIGPKIAAMRQLLEQQIDKNPLRDGPSSNRRAIATLPSGEVEKKSPSTPAKHASQKKGAKMVSPRIMEAIDQLSAETMKKVDFPSSKDTAIDMTREAFRHLRNRMEERATPEVKLHRVESNDKHIEKVPEDRSVADIRKQLEAKMAEEGDKTFSGKGTSVLPCPVGREEKHSSGDSAESFSERKTYLDKKLVHDTLVAKDDNSSQTLTKTSYEILESPAKIAPVPFPRSSRSLPDTRSLSEEALSTPQAATPVANTYCGDGSSTVRQTVLKLEKDADQMADHREDILVPRRKSSSEMFLKLRTTPSDSEKDGRKKLNVQQPELPEGRVRDTVDNIEKLSHQHEQGSGNEEESTAQQLLDPNESDYLADGAVSSLATQTIVRFNLFYVLLDKIYSLCMKVVNFVTSYLP
ncbi:uncharacterized protein LOC144925056 [Branchiostoma floridae x Branchiostoma belcheri]